MSRRNNRNSDNALYRFIGEHRPSLDPGENERRQEALAERKRQARKNISAKAKTDWSQCIVPGCGLQTLKQVDYLVLLQAMDFPICSLHAELVWEMVERNDTDPRFVQSRAALRARRDAIRAEFRAVDEAATVEYQAELKAGTVTGDIYFVRTNGLIKVGWTSDLPARVRAYGPTAVLLCYYPGTRQDETTLHRQLTPARAKGREWYEDGDVLAGFVAEAIEKHGKPTFKVQWTEHRQGPTPRRRAS